MAWQSVLVWSIVVLMSSCGSLEPPVSGTASSNELHSGINMGRPNEHQMEIDTNELLRLKKINLNVRTPATQAWGSYKK